MTTLLIYQNVVKLVKCIVVKLAKLIEVVSEQIMREVKIGLTELRTKISAVRDRVLAGDTYLCLYKRKVKAELVKANDLSELNPPTQLSISYFRQNLTACWIALESDPSHRGFVINLYGRPWGIFRRSGDRQEK